MNDNICLTKFNFQLSQLNQQEFEQLADLFLKHPIVYTTSKYIQYYTFHLIPTQLLKKERTSKVPIHSNTDKVEMLLDILEHYEKISPLNKEKQF